jgi:ABC transport system ATP-binding/permease protein
MDMGERVAADSVDQEDKPVATFEMKDAITFGRDPDNDVALEDDWVSLHHAKIERRDEFVLVDLGSASGIHHNGQRVTKTIIHSGDVFAIGRHDFVFRDASVFRHEDRGQTLIEAYDLTVQVPSRSLWRRRRHLEPLIDDVSFVVRRGTLLGVVGPSGSGKSTLLKAVTGVQPATQGRLVFDGENLYLRSGPRRGIGMVPQEDIMHKQLTVRRALRLAAALRCPREMNRKERAEQINHVITMLGLEEQRALRIDKLSGGQQKRTSVALELLTTPPLLCLDEPTSGLDPALDRDVMGALRDLANDDNTVIVTTHSPLHLDACDYVLVMCRGGRMTYFGPPGEELFTFFGQTLYADVFREITNDPEIWAQKFRNSQNYRDYVGRDQLQLLEQESRKRSDAASVTPTTVSPQPSPDGADATTTGPQPRLLRRRSPAPAATSAAPTPRQRAAERGMRPPNPLRQLGTLCVRMASLILSDRKYALLLVGLPAVLAGLSRLIPGSKGLAPDPEGFSLEANRLLIVLVTGAAFMGIAVPIREIINEVDIYKRERAVGLSPTAYLLSKVVMFVILDCIQVAIFVYLTLLGRGAPHEALVLPDPTLEVMLAVALVAIASTALGLFVSALVRTVEQTTPYLVVSVMAQLILSGALFQITGQKALEIPAWLDPSRWGYAAAAATSDFQRFPFSDPLWHHDTTNWWHAVLFLCLQIVVLLGATRWALRRYEPGRG